MHENAAEITNKIIAAVKDRRDVFIFSEKMIPGKKLRKRWPGLRVRELVQGIDDSNDKTNPTVISNSYNMMDFPLSYLLIGSFFNEDDQIMYVCMSCESDHSTGKQYIRPYKMRKDGTTRKYNLRRVIFQISDVEKYEKDKKWLFESEDDDSDSVEKTNYNIYSSWWAGKDYNSIVNDLKGSVAKEIIAYILVEKIKISLTDVGKCFASDEINKDIHVDAKTYQRRTKNLLQKAVALYNITFVD